MRTALIAMLAALGACSGDGVRHTTCDGGACDPSMCGDGVVQAGEECDLGAANADTGSCTTACKNAACGDGFVQPGEECDDGAQNSNTGACLVTCQTAKCGDGFVQAGVEDCEPGVPITAACDSVPGFTGGGALACNDGVTVATAPALTNAPCDANAVFTSTPEPACTFNTHACWKQPSPGDLVLTEVQHDPYQYGRSYVPIDEYLEIFDNTACIAGSNGGWDLDLRGLTISSMPTLPPCGTGMVSCSDGTCIATASLCNGVADCANGQDEMCSLTVPDTFAVDRTDPANPVLGPTILRSPWLHAGDCATTCAPNDAACAANRICPVATGFLVLGANVAPVGSDYQNGLPDNRYVAYGPCDERSSTLCNSNVGDANAPPLLLDRGGVPTTLAIAQGTTVIDSVTYDDVDWPNSHNSLSLSLSQPRLGGNAAQANDDRLSWCEAKADNYTDSDVYAFGTPGANNRPCRQVSLTVQGANNAGSTITTNAYQVSPVVTCPGGPCQAAYEDGASFDLVANPQGADCFDAEGWGGDCDGSTIGVPFSNDCSVSSLTADISVTARFNYGCP